MKTQLSLLLLFICLALSCEQPDTLAPSIIIVTPEENSSFLNGQAIDIAVDIEDDVMLHSYSLTILTPDNGEIKWTASQQINVQEFSIRESFLPEVKLTTSFLLKIEARDATGNENKTETEFQVNL
ncbi:MAG: hypothetical protein AAF587_20560 [Bacteroidota bacterium]